MEELAEINEKTIENTDCLEIYIEIQEILKRILGITDFIRKDELKYFIFKATQQRVNDCGELKFFDMDYPILLEFDRWYINNQINTEITVAICKFITPFPNIMAIQDISVDLRYLTDKKCFYISGSSWGENGNIFSDQIYFGSVQKI